MRCIPRSVSALVAVITMSFGLTAPAHASDGSASTHARPSHLTHVHVAAEAGNQEIATARLSGQTRFDTAVAVSRRAFPSSAASVYLARADEFADALAGGALTDGPVLLVPSAGAVPASVLAEIRRVQPREVVALGGTGAVGASVLQQAAQGRRSGRLAGADRFATAVAISKRAFPTGASEVYIAGAHGSPDAVAGGVLTQGPVLPVPRTGAVPSVIRAEIDRLAPAAVLALGGTSAVSAPVLRSAAGIRTTSRLAGANRFQTAARIARHAFPGGAKTAYLARSDVFADAVAGGVLRDGPILLVPPPGLAANDSLGEAITEADVLAVESVIALGGTSAVADATLRAVSQRARNGTKPAVTPPLPSSETPAGATLNDGYCDTAIRRTWPLRLDSRYTISCVDDVTIDGTPAGVDVLGLTSSSVYLDTGALADGHIQIRRGLPNDLTDTVIVHELAHAYSYARLSLAQRTWFATQVGQRHFESGSYATMPSEVWANSQSTCLGYPTPDARTVACDLLTAAEKR